MKYGTVTMAGSDARSARFYCRLVAALAVLAAGPGIAQTLYKYQDANGDWIYSDRPPAGAEPAEVRELSSGGASPELTVTASLVGRSIRLTAANTYHAPVQVIVALDRLDSVQRPSSGQPLRWVVDARSERILLELPATEDNARPAVDYRYIWIAGDPAARHRPERPYRAPFAIANQHLISQAFPVGMTHQTPDSYYAVDISMPIGTDVYAARGGVVFDVASNNFRGGMDPVRDAASANIVRILHDDGTHAVYAHLNWNSIRVRPGDRVERGEYIADSGNTGFSTGPHLHFAVLINRGMRLESVPVTFEGPDRAALEPVTGNQLTAY